MTVNRKDSKKNEEKKLKKNQEKNIFLKKKIKKNIFNEIAIQEKSSFFVVE